MLPILPRGGRPDPGRRWQSRRYGRRMQYEEGGECMRERLAKLLEVKSLVTLVLTGVFAYLAAVGQVQVDQFLTVFTVIIAFYFGTQTQKQANAAKKNK